MSPRQQYTGGLAERLISIFYEGTQHQAVDYLHAKALPVLITVSTSNTRGRKKPFSTLLILSFTLATSILVLRGTLVLVRRILSNGTLEVKRTDHRAQPDLLRLHSADTIILQYYFTGRSVDFDFINSLYTLAEFNNTKN